MSLMDFLQNAASALGGNPEQQVDHIAQNAPEGALGQLLAGAFHSDQTPAFGNMVGELFGQSNGAQQAGMLNQLLATLGPAVLSGAAGGALGNLLQPGATQVTPEQASQLSPAQVQEIATHAEQAHPGIVDQIAGFYAQHPALVKTIGSAALAIALAKFKEHQQG
ncbi:hypothetical protein OR16_16442 [Cupriavidus basilensis OR16]|uniref:Uncharacterized protein n=1 Tax=Cupriavidus basilensis OR16 TaxID=1127483 RepID=H1S5Z3_9BURK|nr:hypothetical protein [Cupriavidus basilensis]EHP42036.1 hypothetical protein OR16_16442 [Cupriavidus basilensis OR16]